MTTYNNYVERHKSLVNRWSDSKLLLTNPQLQCLARMLHQLHGQLQLVFRSWLLLSYSKERSVETKNAWESETTVTAARIDWATLSLTVIPDFSQHSWFLVGEVID